MWNSDITPPQSRGGVMFLLHFVCVCHHATGQTDWPILMRFLLNGSLCQRPDQVWRVWLRVKRWRSEWNARYFDIQHSYCDRKSRSQVKVFGSFFLSSCSYKVLSTTEGNILLSSVKRHVFCSVSVYVWLDHAFHGVTFTCGKKIKIEWNASGVLRDDIGLDHAMEETKIDRSTSIKVKSCYSRFHFHVLDYC